ncbi:hypothetical protein [Paenibacillus oleatilyticus]|nr:hypothetical protein [Paenibacillus oleatilyticus]
MKKRFAQGASLVLSACAAFFFITLKPFAFSPKAPKELVDK